MSKTICPGQDTRFWKSDDIFNITCSECAKMVEFFKDDVSRKCPNCGNRIQNPKISLGCAIWCQNAEKCLGYDPAVIESNINDKDNSSLCSDIINAIKLKFGDDSSIYLNGELALEKALPLLKTGTADPRIVKTSILLMEVDFSIYNDGAGEVLSLPVARSILKDASVDTHVIDEICEVIIGCHNGDDIDSPEFAIVNECYRFIKEK